MKEGTIKAILVHIALIVLGFTFINSHKFFVSLTEVRIYPEKNTIEISLRIFPDDLDLALEKIHGSNPNIATEIEDSLADQWLEQYIHDNFTISINDKNLNYKYLGKMPESDAVWCFLEINSNIIPEKLIIKNTILTHFFEDQKNIIQVYYLNQSKGLLLDRIKPFGTLKFNNTTSSIYNYHNSDKPL